MRSILLGLVAATAELAALIAVAGSTLCTCEGDRWTHSPKAAEQMRPRRCKRNDRPHQGPTWRRRCSTSASMTSLSSSPASPRKEVVRAST
jgi:hypothetical protein